MKVIRLAPERSGPSMNYDLHNNSSFIIYYNLIFYVNHAIWYLLGPAKPGKLDSELHFPLSRSVLLSISWARFIGAH